MVVHATFQDKEPHAAGRLDGVDFTDIEARRTNKEAPRLDDGPRTSEQRFGAYQCRQIGNGRGNGIKIERRFPGEIGMPRPPPRSMV
jgi:hypothetical protein